MPPDILKILRPSIDVLMPYAVAAAADEIVAGTRLWLERAVIGLNLCPFAKAVYNKEQIRYAITAARSADELLAELAHEMEMLKQTDPSELDTTLLIHPLAMTNFMDYHFFLGDALATVKNLGLEGVIQIASLHPDYEFSGTATDDIDNYTNRSPYPTLHLLREASVDRAVAAYPDAAEIFARNIKTLHRLGHQGWQQLWLAGEKKK